MDRSDPPEDPRRDDMVVVGRVQGAYGIQGWIRLVAYTDPPENIRHYDSWMLRAERPATAGGNWEAVEVLQIRPHKQGFVARIEGCDDRNAAESLGRRDIGIRATELPDADDDEFYWRDLQGMEVRDQSGRSIGLVVELIDTGVHDVLVVKPAAVAENSATDDVLIPFHRRYVLKVDADARIIRVDWD